jgi:glycerol-1-phosphate dehydrogenase [NAD(P)+]
MMAKKALPPPIFRHDPADMTDLENQIGGWGDHSKLPELGLQKVVVAPDAILQLPAVLEGLSPKAPGDVVLVLDGTLMRRGGEDLKPMVRRLLEREGFEVRVVELEGDERGVVHPDFREVETVKGNIRPGVPVVALGSGVITDITKHACFTYEQEHPDEPRVPLAVCQTANSAPAFASGMAVISKDGVKRTWPSRLPHMLVADVEVLREAPLEYSLSGIGDMSAGFVSFGDWYLNDYVNGVGYLGASWKILEDVRALMIPYAGEIGDRSQVGMEVLAKVLALGGLSMTFARETSPLSGYEHVVSHMLDMGAERFGRPVASHGLQVGVATVPCAISWDHLLENLDPGKVNIDDCYPSFEEMEERVRGTFDEIDSSGAMGDECWSDYRQKLEGWREARPRFEALLEDWGNQKVRLRELVMEPEVVVGALAAAGHPLLFEELNVPVPESEARWAFRNAHLMRKRFSSGDLLFYMGWFDEAFSDHVFARMHELVKETREQRG